MYVDAVVAPALADPLDPPVALPGLPTPAAPPLEPPVVAPAAVFPVVEPELLPVVPTLDVPPLAMRAFVSMNVPPFVLALAALLDAPLAAPPDWDEEPDAAEPDCTHPMSVTFCDPPPRRVVD